MDVLEDNYATVLLEVILKEPKNQSFIDVQPRDYDFAIEKPATKDVYFHYVLPILLIVALAVNLVSLILIVKSKCLQKHHASIYVLSLITCTVLSNVFFLFHVILTETVQSRNTSGLPIFCRIFMFFERSSYKCYVPLLAFALIDRLIQTLADRSKQSSARLTSAARTFCSSKSAKICVIITVAFCTISSFHYLFTPYTLEYGVCYRSYISLVYHLDELIFAILTILLYISALVYSSLCCVRDKKYSDIESKEKESNNAEDDWNATKAFLILFGLFFLLNWYITFHIIVATTKSLYVVVVTVDVLFHLHDIVTPLVYVFYWPGLKRQPDGESAYLIK